MSTIKEDEKVSLTLISIVHPPPLEPLPHSMPMLMLTLMPMLMSPLLPLFLPNVSAAMSSLHPRSSIIISILN